MSPAQYYREVSQRLRQAKIDLQKAYDDMNSEEAARLVNLIQVLVPEEIEAYNRWMKS